EEARDQVRGTLSVLLKGVISQHLCKRASGEGRIAAVEVLLQTYALAHMIRDGKAHQIDGYLQSAELAGTGMQSLDACLLRYVREGQLLAEEALSVASSPDLLRKQIAELPEDA